MFKLLRPKATLFSASVLVVSLAGSIAYPLAGSAQGVTYQPPTRGAPTGSARVGGGTRGPDGKLTSLNVLAPDHVGLTATDQPALYWFTSNPLDAPVELTLLGEGGLKPALELALSPPIEAGIHKLELAKHGVRLEPGVPYQWFVAVVVDATQRSGDIVAGGEVQRMAPPPDMVKELERSGAAGAAAVYARAGYWYDALEALSARVDGAPGDPEPRAQRAALLEQAGLVEAASYERGAKR